MNIPIKYVDEGIHRSIYNSLELLVACNSIFSDKENFKEIGISLPKTQEYARYSIVMYYYAVEEFGKALKLKEDKKIAE